MGAVQGAARHDAVSGERIAIASRTRARTVDAFAAATRELLGESAAREVMADLSPIDGEWAPTADVVEICERAWRLMHGDVSLRNAWADRMIDHGFGRVRKLLLAVATPAGLLRRAGELWRDEFSDGRLIAYTTSPTSATASLHEHAFVETALMRDIISETFRYTLTLTGARDAREVHEIHANGTLVIRLSW